MPKVSIVVDQTSKESLELINFLHQVDEVEHKGDGVYEVTGDPDLVQEVTAMFDSAVLKVEVE